MVAQPALRGAAILEAACAVRCRQLAWIGLAATLLSGLAWVAVEIMAMTERSLGEAMHDGLVSIVLTQTTFGLVADLRLALALLLAAALAFAGATAASRAIALGGAAALLEPRLVRPCRRHGRTGGPAPSGGGCAAPARRRCLDRRPRPARPRAGERAPRRRMGGLRRKNRTPLLAHGNRQRRHLGGDRRRQCLVPGRLVAGPDRHGLRSSSSDEARFVRRPARPGGGQSPAPDA